MRTPACDPQSATPTAPEEGPVTVVVSRVVRAEATAAVEAWLEGISRAAERFEGHQGVTIIRPSDSARPEYLLIFRFDRYEHLRQWNESPVRAEWLEHARPFTIEEPRLRELTGLEHWFTLPHRPAGIPPPRHKMAILTWVAISPLVVMLRMILQPLMGGLPAVFQTLAMTAMLVMLMTYIVMPRVTHRSGPGFRDPDGSRCSGGRARG